jgi:hypothetical protein
METALKRTPAPTGALDARLHDVKAALIDLDTRLNGPASKREIGENYPPTVSERLFTIGLSVETSTYGPTQTSLESLEIANAELAEIRSGLDAEIARLDELESDLIAAGSPYIEGGSLPE